MSESDINSDDNKRRKRKFKDPSEYKRNRIKDAIIKGESYVGHKGKEVPAKKPLFSCGCKKDCLRKIGEDNVNDIFAKFHDINTKNEQDLYLYGLIDIEEVNQRRPRKENARVNSGSFKYNLLIGSSRQTVCIKAFLHAFGSTPKRLRRIRQLKQAGLTPEDKRGKGISFSLPTETKHLVREHIASFPVKESHYSGQLKQYLNADLDVKIMHNLFREKHPATKISYDCYRRFLKENFTLSFGRPQVDTCCTCEELNIKIKSPHLNEVAKRTAVADLLVHKRRSKKFYSALKYEASEDGQSEKSFLSISFDYMQNISLPKIPVQELFYLRQLTVNVFCITNIKTNTSSIYLYHEGQARKGPNEVCSFLNDYLNHVAEDITEVRIFSDNCAGQNKNHALSRFLLYLTDTKKFKKIQHFYPVRGHSYLPCDRDFGLIKRLLRKTDRIFSLYEIVELIVKSSKPGKFIVKLVNTDEILDFKTWWEKLYKTKPVSDETRRKPRNEKVYFGISSLYHFVFESKSKGYIKAFNTINGLNCQNFFMSLTKDELTLPKTLAYPDGKVKIKVGKTTDLKKMMQYIPDDHRDLYTEITEWPTQPDNASLID